MELEQPEIWQEYDCPDSGIDFDIDEADIVAVGEQFYCSGCGKRHTATPDFPINTFVRLVAGGKQLEFRGTPKDAAEKSAWLNEVALARAGGKRANITLTRLLLVALFPIDVLVGSVLLLIAPNSGVTQSYCFGDWRDEVYPWQ